MSSNEEIETNPKSNIMQELETQINDLENKKKRMKKDTFTHIVEYWEISKIIVYLNMWFEILKFNPGYGSNYWRHLISRLHNLNCYINMLYRCEQGRFPQNVSSIYLVINGKRTTIDEFCNIKYDVYGSDFSKIFDGNGSIKFVYEKYDIIKKEFNIVDSRIIHYKTPIAFCFVSILQ